MKGGPLPASVKRTSVLRRVPPFGNLRFAQAPGFEGCVCAFKLAPETSPIIVEAVTGRSMTVVPGDVFLATPGYRESTRFAVGGIPKRGLIPGNNYWVLSESGVVGNLIGGTPLAKTHLGEAKYLGVVCGDDRQTLNIRDFALPAADRLSDKRVLDTCLSIPADSVLIECGGDMMGANVPIFLKHLKRRRSRAKVILAAADALGALSGTRMLREIGLSVSLITGPCTDSPTLRQRTEALCRTPAMNMARSASIGALV
jgi:hypothetical protein